jgi:ribosomal protein S12 methylthiotransferase
VVLDPDTADVLVVNTCAFIGPAKEESIDAVLDAARAKAAREGRRLVVTGCLAQRFADDLVRELPEVDAFVGTGDLTRIADAVAGPQAGVPVVYRGAQHELPPHGVSPRVRTGAWWTAYLKVSEGCDHRCSFCIIPKIRGRHESRPPTDVLSEAASLVGDGAIELNLIAQDLTAYGRDLADGATLARLLRALAMRVPGARWLRLLYAYPSSVTDDLLEVIASEPAVCKYLDMPLQHIADDMLRAMRRERSGAAIRRLLGRIRAAVPGIAMRSSFIVGFPGETEEEFEALLRFVEEAGLDHVGVFTYSHEDSTTAVTLHDDVPRDVKDERRARVMELQQEIAFRRNDARRGEVQDVLVEGAHPETEHLLVGRLASQAPEVDGQVLINDGFVLDPAADDPRLVPHARPGAFARVEITDTAGYDLVGRIVGAA